jgi:hypothetical protein
MFNLAAGTFLVVGLAEEPEFGVSPFKRFYAV